MGTGKIFQILLSTYNGERYLKEQLDSYIHLRNYEQVKVLVRDDGSTDNTVRILREYQTREGFEIILGSNVGINASFGELLRRSDPECRYFAFSDQDDVWIPDKLSIAQRTMEAVAAGREPLLFASRSQIVDETLTPIGSSILPVRGLSFRNAMVQNVCPGHTQVFNQSLRELLCQGNIAQAHVVDWWVYLLASGAGRVVFSEKFTVLHRQHTGNAVGYQINPLRQFRTRLRRMRSNEAAQITRQLAGFAQNYKHLLMEEDRVELERFLANQHCFSSRLQYAFTGRFYRQSAIDTALVRGLYATGKYRLRGERS